MKTKQLLLAIASFICFFGGLIFLGWAAGWKITVGVFLIAYGLFLDATARDIDKRAEMEKNIIESLINLINKGIRERKTYMQ